MARAASLHFHPRAVGSHRSLLSTRARWNPTAISRLRLRRARLNPTAHLSSARARWDLPANFPLPVCGGIPPPSLARAVGCRRHPLVSACAGESHCRILFYLVQRDPTATPRLPVRGWIPPPSPHLHLRGEISPPSLVYARAVGSRRRHLIYACSTESHRRPSFMRARVDPTAVPHLCAVGSGCRLSSFTCARAHPTANFPRATGGRISPPLPSFTRAQMDPTAIPSFTRVRVDTTAIPSFLRARVDPTAVSR
ncbi:hypothetical protein B0H16DRAFT_1744341 [Mycena metata]|uniref:Uncharacterized protein n=1 Tax=Mycena metata TaxID=1033252 RepID=A0AAD7H553_9AGAR|nr:hypothetical protein B0H16DRAFT_1744341 [Mycena metata]